MACHAMGKWCMDVNVDVGWDGICELGGWCLGGIRSMNIIYLFH
jgi:hypothetical protein